MRYVLLFALLLLAGCQQLVPPTDPLYQRWRNVVGGSYTTFQPDGLIRYGADGRDGVCCGPRYFRRRGNVVVLNLGPPRPVTLPPDIRPVDCSAVRCAYHGDAWRILRLTKTELVLEKPWATERYVAAP